MNVLVISAHTDDGILGAGGTIVKHLQDGDDVSFCVVTKGYVPEWPESALKQEKEEVLKVQEMLHVKKVYFLDYPAAKLDTVPQKELNDSISGCVTEVQPDIIYTHHHGDLNKDHRLVFEATMVAVRPLTQCSVKKVLSYETFSSTEWAPPFVERIFAPNLYVGISDTLDSKLKAMSIYETEIREYPHPRSLEVLSAYAKQRGAQVGLSAAEAFMLIREIQR